MMMTSLDVEILVTLSGFIIMAIASLGGGKNKYRNNSIIYPETSSLQKAFCCILIVCHHFSLRADGGIIRRLFAMGGGTFSLVIFLLLSSYGIAMSERNHPTTLIQYSKKRILKILKPYTLITIVAIVIYYTIGADAPSDVLTANRISQAFVYIGQHKSGLIDMLYYLIGIKTFDGAMWFVGVTVYSYVAFGLSKYASKGVQNCGAQKRVFIIYCLLIALFAFSTFELNFPAHYYRNLWALPLGLWLALYGNKVQGFTVKKTIVTLIELNMMIFLWLKITSSGNIMYLVFSNIALGSIWLCNRLFDRYSLKKGSLIVILAGLSYYVYLIHIKVLTIEWWYIGYKTLLLPLIIILILSFVYSKNKKLA